MMRFTPGEKQQLLRTANQVYQAYAGLDFFKTRTFDMTKIGEPQKKTLMQLCLEAEKAGTLDQQLEIAGKIYQLQLTQVNPNVYTIQIKQPLHVGGRKVTVATKAMSEYQDEDVLDLLTKQQFQLEIADNGDVAVANFITGEHKIGGQGKIDLYRTHLVTLHNIIEKISAEEDISSLLIALATGSGKTYVQALWMYILFLTSKTGIFGIPDKLIPQFCKDINKLLPDKFGSHIAILRDQQEASEAEQRIANLGDPEATPGIVIASSERLLDRHYQELLQANPDKTFLSFDEQHLLMQVEVRRVRLIELSKKLLTMVLTATPNEETYQLSGYKPVAIMSSGQKQKAGQGQFPRLFKQETRSLSDKNALKDYRFWTGEFWGNLFNSFTLRLTNAIQKEETSAAVSSVFDLPLYLVKKPNESSLRWRLQVPMARKLLCIVDDNEELVNFCYALKENSRKIYCHGNILDRSQYAFFDNNVDKDIIEQDRKDKLEAYLAVLSPEEKEIGETLANRSLKDQLKLNIFHNFIEYVLSDITGYDEITHNRLRKENPKAFLQLVIDKFSLKDEAYYHEKLNGIIDANGAYEIGSLLAKVSSFLGQAIEQMEKPAEQEALQAFVDNWALSDKLFAVMKRDYRFYHRFEDYANKHLIIGIMSGMKNAETPIKESIPFLGLTEEECPIFGTDGMLSPEAKKRKHSIHEMMDSSSKESHFKPNYLKVSEEFCDNYFRLGFVGAYISNKKTEGFSDVNLHTVLNIANRSIGTTNRPDNLIQGLGRNRGFDETQTPVYIHALGHRQESFFDLQHLEEDDYYPELFKAQKRYNKRAVAALGEQVGSDIIDWFYANLDAEQEIEPEQLKRQVLRLIVLALRQLNDKNCHEMQLSRAQLPKVISHAMKKLNDEIKQLQKPYRFSRFMSGLISLLNFISECYYSIKRIAPALALNRHREKTTNAADKIYIKIIKKTSFKAFFAKLTEAREFYDWFSRNLSFIDPAIKRDLESLLKPQVTEDLLNALQQGLFPVLKNMVISDKANEVLTALNGIPNKISFFLQHQKLISSLNMEEEDFSMKLLSLFHDVPGLKSLELTHLLEPERAKIYFDSLPAETQDKLTLLNEFICDEKLLDRKKIAKLTTEKLGPILFHPKFISNIKKLIGFLSEADLQVILRAKEAADSEREAANLEKEATNPDKKIADPEGAAKQLIQFLSLSQTEIIEQFLSFKEEESLDFAKLPIQTIWENLSKVTDEIMDCHCYYNQHDHHGNRIKSKTEKEIWRPVEKKSPKPALLKQMSKELRGIKVDAPDSTLSNLSREMFYVQGLRKGLAEGSKISADSNKHLIRVIERVKYHILRPLWWSVNVSKLSYAIIKAGSNLTYALKARVFEIWNGKKTIGNSIARSDLFNIIKRNNDTSNYNDTAFSYAKKINQLSPLTRQEVAMPDCPPDTLTHIVKTLSGGPFFVPASSSAPDRTDRLQTEACSSVIS